MLLVLKNADFSANNIGNVPISVALSEEAKDVLKHYTKYPVEQTNEYAQAVNSLINGLVSKGLYDKISVLAIPVIASTIDECAINCKTGATVKNNDKFILKFALNESGEFVRTAETFADEATQYGYDITHSSDDFSMFGIYIKKTGETEDMCGARTTGWYAFKNIFKYIEDGPSGQVLSGGNAVMPQGGSDALLAGYGTITSPFVISYDSGVGYYKDSRFSRTGNYTPNDTSLIMYYPLLTGHSAIGSNGSMMLYGCGYKLTESEVSELFRLLSDFYIAIKS